MLVSTLPNGADAPWNTLLVFYMGRFTREGDIGVNSNNEGIIDIHLLEWDAPVRLHEVTTSIKFESEDIDKLLRYALS